MISYKLPERWFRFDVRLVLSALVDAKAAVDALRTLPCQRDWVETLQLVQLKREVAGTSRIEGADFTDRELDEAMEKQPEDLVTRSQRQASAAVRAYRWIGSVPADRPIDGDLVKSVHRLIVAGADDDHCPPGVLRGAGQNVTFGSPAHRGAEGGEECQTAFDRLMAVMNGEGREHDPLIRALAFHYHFAAMHPFLDGNGRTARAMEALLLGRAGLRDVCFIAMSNYYYEEKPQYLRSLSEVRARDYDLTPFLVFGLNGVRIQVQAVLREIRTNISRALFRNVMYDLFNRLKTPKKRVIAKRQIEILKHLLDVESMPFETLASRTEHLYRPLRNPWKAFVRDLSGLLQLQAVRSSRDARNTVWIRINLDWPTQITETEFFRKIKEFPKSKTFTHIG